MQKAQKIISKWGYVIGVVLLIAPILIFFIEGSVLVECSDGTKELLPFALSQFSFKYSGEYKDRIISFEPSPLLVIALVAIILAMIFLFLTIIPSRYRFFIVAIILVVPIISFFIASRIIIVKDVGLFQGVGGFLHKSENLLRINPNASLLTISKLTISGGVLLLINALILFSFGIFLNINKKEGVS